MTQNSGPTGNSRRAASHGRSCSQPPGVHADLAGMTALAVAHQQRAAPGIEVALAERQRFGNAQAAAPEHDHQTAEPVAVGRRVPRASLRRSLPRLADRRDRAAPCCAADVRRGSWALSPASDVRSGIATASRRSERLEARAIRAFIKRRHGEVEAAGRIMPAQAGVCGRVTCRSQDCRCSSEASVAVARRARSVLHECSRCPSRARSQSRVDLGAWTREGRLGAAPDGRPGEHQSHGRSRGPYTTHEWEE
jgi:hypothetical protein